MTIESSFWVSSLFLFVMMISITDGFSSSPTNAPKTSPIIALNVEFKVKPERREEFLDIIRHDAKQTMETEPGAVQFVIGEDVDTPNIFYLHEQYKTMADFEFHQTTSHFADFTKFCETKDPFVSDENGTPSPTIEVYQCNHHNHDATMGVKKVPLDRSAYCLNVKLYIHDNVREEFLTVIKNNQKGSTEDEPLCLQYHYGENVDTSNHFHFHEQYTGADDGKEGFEAHAAAPHFKVWEEFAAKEPFTSPPVVQFYKTLKL